MQFDTTPPQSHSQFKMANNSFVCELNGHGNAFRIYCLGNSFIQNLANLGYLLHRKLHNGDFYRSTSVVMWEQCCKFTQNNVATLLQPFVALQIVVANQNIMLTSGEICLSDGDVHKICKRLILTYAHNIVDGYFF